MYEANQSISKYRTELVFNSKLSSRKIPVPLYKAKQAITKYQTEIVYNSKMTSKKISLPFEYKVMQSKTKYRAEIVFNSKMPNKKISVPSKYKAKQSIPSIKLKPSSTVNKKIPVPLNIRPASISKYRTEIVFSSQ